MLEEPRTRDMATREEELMSGLQLRGIGVLNLQGLDANRVGEQWEPGAGTLGGAGPVFPAGMRSRRTVPGQDADWLTSWTTISYSKC